MVSLQSVSRRQHHRFERPQLAVRLNGAEGQTKDWSLGGLAVQLGDGALSRFDESDQVSGELEVGSQGLRHPFEGRVVRVDEDRDVVALEFSRLSEGAVMTFVGYFRTMMVGAH